MGFVGQSEGVCCSDAGDQAVLHMHSGCLFPHGQAAEEVAHRRSRDAYVWGDGLPALLGPFAP